MTKLATNFEWPEPIPGWDLMKWKDETQAAILRETEGMTDEEVREYFRKASERFDEDMKQRRAELAKRQESENEK